MMPEQTANASADVLDVAPEKSTACGRPGLTPRKPGAVDIARPAWADEAEGVASELLLWLGPQTGAVFLSGRRTYLTLKAVMYGMNRVGDLVVERDRLRAAVAARYVSVVVNDRSFHGAIPTPSSGGPNDSGRKMPEAALLAEFRSH